jgi:hypothetical protein
MYSFDFDEPATLPNSQSLIRRLDTAFQASNLGYKTVGYGRPLAIDYPEDEGAGVTKNVLLPDRVKRPWWKFW